jgi:hypothetical protein
MGELGVARRFMANRLGPDWEWVLDADAHPGVGQTADLDTAEQRAVQLVCDASGDWRPGLRDAAAYVWRVLAVNGARATPRAAP